MKSHGCDLSFSVSFQFYKGISDAGFSNPDATF